MGAVVAGSSLVSVCDSAGRPRGTAFPVDFDGTLLTSHEVVDGLDRAVLCAPGVGSVLAENGQIIVLPEWNLALLRTTGLRLEPFVLATGRARLPGTHVRLCAERPLAARVAGTASVTYAATDRFHSLDDVLTLALPRPAASRLRLSNQASGSPVLDAATGAVLAVLGTAMHAPSGGRAAAFAVQPRVLGGLQPAGPLARLLRHNDATVPGFGPDLNLAGALRLTGPLDRPPPRTVGRPLLRPEIAEELRAFGDRDGAASVVALVGDPGSGRTTELAAWAARRTRSAAPAPNVWLRGADLWTGDPSVREAVDRALRVAGRTAVEPDDAHRGRDATGTAPGPPVEPSTPGVDEADGTDIRARRAGDSLPANPDVVARLARDAGRPLVVLLDAPEEMPPALQAGLRNWTSGSSSWLRASGARLAVACRPEFWERWGALFPADILHVPGRADAACARLESGSNPPSESPVVPIRRAVPRSGAPGTAPAHRTGAVLPPCVRVGELTPGQAARLRDRGGLAVKAIAVADARHPLTLRMAADIAAAWGPIGASTTGELPAGRHGALAGDRPLVTDEILAGHLDLLCLRIALRLTAWEGAASAKGHAVPGDPVPSPSAVRRRAARASGQLHAAARRALASANGELSRAEFSELFPEQGGWASAVVAEGALVPTGETYHFADEEFGDWLQGCHVELGSALDTLVHHARPDGAVDRIPRHRIGPVLQALLRCERLEGSETLGQRLRALLPALRAEPAVGASEPSWWAAHLLGETLSRVPDAGLYLSVLDALAARIRSEGGSALFGPWFWRKLPLRTSERMRLLRQLLPTDPAYAGPRGADRHLDTVVGLLGEEPEVVAPLLCTWFDDERLLAKRGADSPPTVAGAAQALLYAHPGRRSPEFLRTLADCPHPRARELLTELDAVSDAAHMAAEPPTPGAPGGVMPLAALPAPRGAGSTAAGEVANPPPVPDPVESPGQAP